MVEIMYTVKTGFLLFIYTFILFLLLQTPSFSQEELIRRGFMGVQVTDITDAVAEEKGLPSKEGVIVTRVFPDSTACEGGIKENDIILEINETKILNTAQFLTLAGSLKEGEELQIIISRENEKVAKELALKPFPKETSPDFEIIYTSVSVKGTLLRAIITKPFGEKKYPALFFIQGLTCSSVEYPFDFAPNPYKTILYELTKKGFVTMRVEKSGIGDSEGIHCKDVGFNIETEGFLRGLEQLKSYDFVDPENVFIFGHSMGGIMAPVIASEIPVKGIIVFGTVSKIWTEYEMENMRRQRELEGVDFVEMEKILREKEEFLYHFYIEKMTPAEIIAAYPQFEEYFDDETHMYGRHYSFFQELYDINFAEKWKNVNTDVLAIWGEGDFVSGREDHILIKDTVNYYNPGKGSYLQMKYIDHSFHRVSSMEKSYRQEYEEDFNREIIDEIYKWINKL